MAISRDEDGQPPPGLFRQRVAQRQVSELLGLCKGMICDGEVTEGEATSLRRWLAGNPNVLGGYPGSVLGKRLLQNSRMAASMRTSDGSVGSPPGPDWRDCGARSTT